MTFVAWFNPKNIEHLQAYKHLMDTGTWPEGFRPDDVEMDMNWQYLLLKKLANTYVEIVLDEYELAKAGFETAEVVK